MDGTQWYDWFRSFTFFNWLALFAFILSLVSFSNAFLSLKSRYRDWRAVQSKKAFEKRLTQLKNLVDEVGMYRKNISAYIVMLSYHFTFMLVVLLMAAIYFVLAFITSSPPITISLFKTMSLFICLCCLGVCMFIVAKPLQLIRYVHNPNQLNNTVVKFLLKGKKKGLISKEEEGVLIEMLAKVLA